MLHAPSHQHKKKVRVPWFLFHCMEQKLRGLPKRHADFSLGQWSEFIKSFFAVWRDEKVSGWWDVALHQREKKKHFRVPILLDVSGTVQRIMTIQD